MLDFYSRHKLKILSLFAGIITMLLFSIIFWNDFLGLWENKNYDFLTKIRGEKDSSDDIIIISIDDVSLKSMGKPWPWNRKLIAEALKKIAGYNPKIIGVDFNFSGPTKKEEDEYFLQILNSISQNIPVVLAANFIKNKELEKIDRQKKIIQETLESPYFPSLYGFVNIPLDEDGVVRSVQWVKTYNVQDYYFFSLRLAQKLLGFNLEQIQKTNSKIEMNGYGAIPVDENDTSLIFFSGPAGSYKKISFFQVYQNPLAHDFIKNKIVLFGQNLSTVNDLNLTPFSNYQGIKSKMSGVEVLANILDGLLQKNMLTKPSKLFNTFLLILLNIIIVFCFLWVLSPSRFLLINFCLIVIYTVFTLVSFFKLLCVFSLLTPLLNIVFLASVLMSIPRLQKNMLVRQEKLNLISEEFIESYDISRREKVIIQLILNGCTNSEIGKKLFISLSTVKKHVYNIFQKLDISRREDLLKLLQLKVEDKKK